MQELELSLRFIKPMHEMGLDYMVTGSIAAIIYGEPRITHDIDIIIDLKPELARAFHEAYDRQEFYVPPFETLKIEAARKMRGHFNLLDKQSGFKADIYLKGEDKLHVWAFNNRSERKVDSERVFIAPPEYVIIRKMLYYKEGRSEKHLEDIRNIIDNTEEQINDREMAEKVGEYGLRDIWNNI